MRKNLFPNDVDEAFVLSYECYEKGKERGFHFCMTTPRLLEILSRMETVAIDATYKVNWLDYPLVCFGTVDKENRFHPLMYACTTHETCDNYAFIFRSARNGIEEYFPDSNFGPSTIIADGADAIRNAFYQEFHETAAVDIMCFVHVLRNIEKRTFAMKNNKPLIIDDIKKMQMAPNRTTFQMMATLFKDKWRGCEPEFVEYFDKQWLGHHQNWYEGAAIYEVSTNNGLESHNALIKRKVTFRRRLPLNEFFIAMSKMCTNISKEFASGKRYIAMKPKVTRDILIQAEQMNQNGLKLFTAKTKSGQTVHILPSAKCSPDNANLTYYKSLLKMQWTSFDEYIKYGFQIFYIVNFSSNEWENKSNCTCNEFFKKHMCPHIVAVGIKQGIIQSPAIANATLLARRKKGGRPKNATSALNK